MPNEKTFIKGEQDSEFLDEFEKLKNAGIRVYFVTTDTHNIIRLY